MTSVVSYNHPLEEHILSAFAVDPNITEEELAGFVKARDGTSKLDLANLAKDVLPKGRVESLREMTVDVLDESYKVPEQLRAYREALEEKLSAQGKFNGPVAVLDGELGRNIRLRRGGYFDFMATKLEVVPATLVPDRYPSGVSIEQLMKEYGIVNEQRARFIGFAFLMLPQNRQEFQLVQRAKGMGIAADCISSSGSTPPFNDDFFIGGFNFGEYWENHVAQEMEEEYKLGKGEFRIDGAYIIDDKKTVPHLALEIQTTPSTAALAERIHGDKSAISEHPVLYSMPPKAIGTFLRRFDVWPSVAFISDLFYRDNVKDN